MTDIQELILKGRPYLIEYLQENGIEFNKNGLFSCIHPDHDDSNPSCGIIPTSNGEEFHCLACRRAGDIYTAAHYLENKPLHGPSFLSDNLEYILNKYEVEHDKIELTEDQILDIKFTKVYDAAVALMFDKNELGSYTHISFDHALSRGWTTKTCIDLSIGSILDFNKYIADLSIKTDLNKDQLIDMGIDNKLFGPTKLTFAIKDHKGKVRGFVCRNMDFKKGGDIEKYYNTSEFRNPFYQKDKLLYGLNIARKYTGLRLDIFEGYGSYVTAYQAGHNRCVAMGGTAFTTDHAQLLYELGFRHINYVMDIDDTGITLSNVYIERFSGFQGLKVTITRLPIPDSDREKDPGANDADYYIKTYGLEAYRKIKTIGAFEHSLLTKAGNLVPESEEAVSFAKDTVKLIMNEENRIERGRMLKTLSETTGVPKEDLESEINRIQGSETTSIKNRLEKKLKNVNNAEQLETLLETGLEELSSTNNTKEDKYLISTAESVEVWDGIFADMNTQQQGIHGWRTGYQILDDRLDGLAKPNRGGVAIGFAGAPQHAKSAMMLNIVTQTVLNNNDVSVLYWAIDDNRKTIAYRLIAMLSGVHIKKVRNMLPRTEDDTIKIKAAQAQLVRWAEEKKLIIKDDLFGRSKKKAEHWITSFQNETGNQILFCIDSLNNIAGEDGAEMRSKMISSSGWAKSLTTRIPCTVLATMELVKNRTDEKPNLMSIAESGKLEYDFDAIAVVWNESQGKYGKIESCKAKWGSPGFWKPVIELDFQKNKCAAGEKGSVYFDFDPGTTSLMNARLDLSVVDTAPIEVKTRSGSIMISSDNDVKPVQKHEIRLKTT
jgi:DNA primase